MGGCTGSQSKQSHLQASRTNSGKGEKQDPTRAESPTKVLHAEAPINQNMKDRTEETVDESTPNQRLDQTLQCQKWKKRPRQNIKSNPHIHRKISRCQSQNSSLESIQQQKEEELKQQAMKNIDQILKSSALMSRAYHKVSSHLDSSKNPVPT